MQVVRLLVLGVVRLRGRAHGYAVHRELAGWKIETWTMVKPGSVYHALKQLTKEGLLRDVGTEASREGPGRTLYALTDRGEAEFRRLRDAALTSVRIDELGAGIAFMQTLPRGQAVALLRDRHRRTAELAAGLTGMKASFPDRAEPPHTQDLLALWSGALTATVGWTALLIGRLEAGEYAMADDAADRADGAE